MDIYLKCLVCNQSGPSFVIINFDYFCLSRIKSLLKNSRLIWWPLIFLYWTSNFHSEYCRHWTSFCKRPRYEYSSPPDQYQLSIFTRSDQPSKYHQCSATLKKEVPKVVAIFLIDNIHPPLGLSFVGLQVITEIFYFLM